MVPCHGMTAVAVDDGGTGRDSSGRMSAGDPGCPYNRERTDNRPRSCAAIVGGTTMLTRRQIRMLVHRHGREIIAQENMMIERRCY